MGLNIHFMHSIQTCVAMVVATGKAILKDEFPMKPIRIERSNTIYYGSEETRKGVGKRGVAKVFPL